MKIHTAINGIWVISHSSEKGKRDHLHNKMEHFEIGADVHRGETKCLWKLIPKFSNDEGEKMRHGFSSKVLPRIIQ